ncbi:hypothetical protein EDD17DRAFT_1504568 [Pisolithus thermaeus]|nr:hypothetical protein EDD17DRAFT_1504568 [Pisolithus thermaeus]
MTGTTSNIIKLQDENVGSPSSKSDLREVMPTCGEPPAIDQGVELLATESSDNGGQADQGEAANIVEATAVAGEAQPVVVAEGGIGSEHHQMTEENSGECLTEGDGATTILASKQQVGEVMTYIHMHNMWQIHCDHFCPQDLSAIGLLQIGDYMIELPKVDE